MQSSDWQKPSHRCWLTSFLILQPELIKFDMDKSLYLISQSVEKLVHIQGHKTEALESPNSA